MPTNILKNQFEGTNAEQLNQLIVSRNTEIFVVEETVPNQLAFPASYDNSIIANEFSVSQPASYSDVEATRKSRTPIGKVFNRFDYGSWDLTVIGMPKAQSADMTVPVNEYVPLKLGVGSSRHAGDTYMAIKENDGFVASGTYQDGVAINDTSGNPVEYRYVKLTLVDDPANMFKVDDPVYIDGGSLNNDTELSFNTAPARIVEINSSARTVILDVTNTSITSDPDTKFNVANQPLLGETLRLGMVEYFPTTEMKSFSLWAVRSSSDGKSVILFCASGCVVESLGTSFDKSGELQYSFSGNCGRVYRSLAFELGSSLVLDTSLVDGAGDPLLTNLVANTFDGEYDIQNCVFPGMRFVAVPYTTNGKTITMNEFGGIKVRDGSIVSIPDSAFLSGIPYLKDTYPSITESEAGIAKSDRISTIHKDDIETNGCKFDFQAGGDTDSLTFSTTYSSAVLDSVAVYPFDADVAAFHVGDKVITSGTGALPGTGTEVVIKELNNTVLTTTMDDSETLDLGDNAVALYKVASTVGFNVGDYVVAHTAGDSNANFSTPAMIVEIDSVNSRLGINVAHLSTPPTDATAVTSGIIERIRYAVLDISHLASASKPTQGSVTGGTMSELDAAAATNKFKIVPVLPTGTKDVTVLPKRSSAIYVGEASAMYNNSSTRPDQKGLWNAVNLFVGMSASMDIANNFSTPLLEELTGEDFPEAKFAAGQRTISGSFSVNARMADALEFEKIRKEPNKALGLKVGNNNDGEPEVRFYMPHCNNEVPADADNDGAMSMDYTYSTVQPNINKDGRVFKEEGELSICVIPADYTG